MSKRLKALELQPLTATSTEKPAKQMRTATHNSPNVQTPMESEVSLSVIDIRKSCSARLVKKNGDENVKYLHFSGKSRRYLRDFATTLIEMNWVYMLAIYVSSYVASYLFFALLCYVIAYFHGDLLLNTGHSLGKDKQPCIIGEQGWTKMLIFSIETQTTNGYGELYPSEECPQTIIVYIIQIICSSAIEGAMVCLIYAKIARPAKQLTKLKFSDKAVIYLRDNKLCLVFRVYDLRAQQSINSKIRLYMLIDSKTCEGETIKRGIELNLDYNGRQLIAWPELICHVIDASSPLRHFNNAKLLNAAQFELYVSIVSTSPSTAQVTEARTSYLPREIYWGQRFVNIISYDALNERYVVDYERFNSTLSVDMNVQE